MTFIAQAANLGKGSLDNLIVAPGVHRSVGILVLVSLLAATAWAGWLAVTKRPWDRTATVLMAVSQLVLMAQALLGIKLLDQGMGIFQLYIHYLGGLVPLGLYLVLGWFPFKDPVIRARVVSIAMAVGLVSAGMAFVIGQAFVNSGGA